MSWTIKTLKKLMDERFIAQEKAVTAAMAAAKEAVTKAEAASERRFEGVNEFRGTLSDQARNFVTRAEADARFNTMAETVARLQKFQDQQVGSRDAATGTRTLLIAVLAIGIPLVISVLGGVLWVITRLPAR